MKTNHISLNFVKILCLVIALISIMTLFSCSGVSHTSSSKAKKGTSEKDLNIGLKFGLRNTPVPYTKKYNSRLLKEQQKIEKEGSYVELR